MSGASPWLAGGRFGILLELVGCSAPRRQPATTPRCAIPSRCAHRATKTASGSVSGDVDEDRFLALWVDLSMAFASEVGVVSE